MARKLTSFLLCIIMILGLPQMVYAANSAVASTLRLEKTSGTVTITNKNGKVVSVRDGVKMYNGYTIKTAASSYAFISLDGTKAVKLDASSSVEVKQSGKNLEVCLLSGNMFFDVTEPVKSGESMSIRTSTMVTGIRGTSGFLRVLDEDRFEFNLLEGVVTLTVNDWEKGEVSTVSLAAGQRAIASRIKNPGGEVIKEEVEILGYDEAHVPGYVAQEIRESVPLQELITDQTELSVPKIIGEADEKLKNDQQAAAKKEEDVQEQNKLLAPEESVVDELFGPDENTGHSSNGTGAIPAEPAPNHPRPPEMPPDSTIKKDATCATLNHYFKYYNTVTVETGVTITIGAGDVLIIAPGKTLTLYGTLVVTDGGQIINNGQIITP